MAKEMVTRVSKDPNMAGVPFLFMLNKQDLEAEKMTTGEIEVELNLAKLFAQGVFRTQACSAKTGEGIWEGLAQMMAVFESKSTNSTGATSNQGTLELGSEQKV